MKVIKLFVLLVYCIDYAINFCFLQAEKSLSIKNLQKYSQNTIQICCFSRITYPPVIRLGFLQIKNIKYHKQNIKYHKYLMLTISLVNHNSLTKILFNNKREFINEYYQSSNIQISILDYLNISKYFNDI